MNSVEIKEISGSYNELFKSTQAYNKFKESLTDSLEDGDLNKEQVESIVEEFKKRLDVVEKFDRELDKFEKYMTPGLLKHLKDALGDEKMILGRVYADASGFLELDNPDFLAALFTDLETEKDISDAFGQEMNDFAVDLGFNLLMQAMDDNISLQDLQLMKAEFAPESELYSRITRVIDVVERRTTEKKQEDENINTVEAKSPEENINTEEAEFAQSANNPASGSVVPAEEVPKPTLEEKIAAVNYKQGMNINAVVQEITLESKLEKIESEVNKLQAKAKLTSKEKFHLRQLIEQQLALETYGDSLEEQRVSIQERIRNQALEANVSTIDYKKNLFEESLKKSEGYKSKTMRFFSARYQNKLTSQMAILQSKQGRLTDKQKASAIVRFDKQSKKIMKKAKRKVAIEHWKELKNSFVHEIENLSHDISRFFSTKEEDMEVLTESVVVMPDNIISLDSRRKERSLAA